MNIDEYILGRLRDSTVLALNWLDELWHYERDDDNSFAGTAAEYRQWRLSHPAWQHAPLAECDINEDCTGFRCSYIHCLDEP